MAKTRKDPFKTTRWQGQRITDPRQVFAEQFLYSPLCGYRRFIKKLLQGTAPPHMPPADVLLYVRIIRSAIMAAHALSTQKQPPVIVEEEGLLNKNYYYSGSKGASPWADFPRCLSKNEYRNPYRAFAAFFRYQPLKQWLHHWQGLTEAALCAPGMPAAPEALTLYCYLVKLVEAAHLIDIRETTHIGGTLKGPGSG